MNLKLMQLKVLFKMFKSLKVKTDKSIQAFFALLRTGLWEQADANLDINEKVDWEKVYQLAEEQSVTGVVLAGIEHSFVKPPQEFLLQWIGEVQIIEQQNKAMNDFVAKLIEKLRKEDVYAILVKGQGIAQCYERPLWRASGDVDLLLNMDNYEKAKKLLIPLASDLQTEYSHFKHQAMTIDGWEVELHGTLHSRLSRRVDNMIDEVQDDVFYGGNVRSWKNGQVQTFLPAPNNDIVFVFTHFLHHFFFEGVGLRQICDWCRLLWTYRDKIDVSLLERRLKKMGLMTEWKAFAEYTVKWLGMPAEAMPLYSDSSKWIKKAKRINNYIMKVGNFGHNMPSVLSNKQPYLVRKFISFWVHAGFTLRHFAIFPKDSIVFFAQVFRSGLHAALRGE